METLTKKVTLSWLLGWIIGVICALVGLALLFSKPLMGIFFIFASLAILPPFNAFVLRKWNFNLSKGVRIVLFIMLIGVAGSFSSKNEDTPSDTPTSGSISTETNPAKSNTSTDIQSVKKREIESIVFAKEIIKNVLKSPSTAKFSNVAAYELSNKKDVWAVNGYVDSQNSYGAMIRNIWEVQLDYRDGKGGTVSSILFDGKKIQ